MDMGGAIARFCCNLGWEKHCYTGHISCGKRQLSGLGLEVSGFGFLSVLESQTFFFLMGNTGKGWSHSSATVSTTAWGFLQAMILQSFLQHCIVSTGFYLLYCACLRGWSVDRFVVEMLWWCLPRDAAMVSPILPQEMPWWCLLYWHQKCSKWEVLNKEFNWKHIFHHLKIQDWAGWTPIPPQWLTRNRPIQCPNRWVLFYCAVIIDFWSTAFLVQ